MQDIPRGNHYLQCDQKDLKIGQELRQISEELFFHVYVLLEKNLRDFDTWFKESQYIKLIQRFSSVNSFIRSEYFQETDEIIVLINKLQNLYHQDTSRSSFREVRDKIEFLVEKYKNSDLKSEMFSGIEYKNLDISLGPISLSFSESSLASTASLASFVSSSFISEEAADTFLRGLPDDKDYNEDDLSEDGNYSLYITRP